MNKVSELYPLCVITRAKLQSLMPNDKVKEHFEEMDLIVSMLEKGQLGPKNEEFISSIVEDALKDATTIIKEIS